MNNTITVSIPDPALSPNSRTHWVVKSKAKAKARQQACLIAMASPMVNAKYKLASTHAVFFHKTNRRRDGDNHLAALKAVFDGFADAGIIGDDSGFAHYPVVFKIDKENPRVEITIKEITE